MDRQELGKPAQLVISPSSPLSDGAIIDIPAESVAEFTERPLLSLSCSDIGTDPDDVEPNLNRWMKRARRWGAILLIDEADVYLEERTAQDFQRNSLVSSKFSHLTLRVVLKSLQYF